MSLAPRSFSPPHRTPHRSALLRIAPSVCRHLECIDESARVQDKQQTGCVEGGEVDRKPPCAARDACRRRAGPTWTVRVTCATNYPLGGVCHVFRIVCRNLRGGVAFVASISPSPFSFADASVGGNRFTLLCYSYRSPSLTEHPWFVCMCHFYRKLLCHLLRSGPLTMVACRGLRLSWHRTAESIKL